MVSTSSSTELLLAWTSESPHPWVAGPSQGSPTSTHRPGANHWMPPLRGAALRQDGNARGRDTSPRCGRRSSRGTTRTPDSHGRKRVAEEVVLRAETSAGKSPMVPGRSSPARRWKDRESPKPSAYAASRACPAPSPSRTDRASVSPGIPGPGIATPRPGNWRDSPRRFSAHAATRCIRRRPRDPGRDGTAVRVVEVAQEADPVVGQRYAGSGRRRQDGRSCIERAVCSMCRCMKKKSIPEALRPCDDHGRHVRGPVGRAASRRRAGRCAASRKADATCPARHARAGGRGMLRRDQPGEQALVEADALASQRKRALDRHEAEILLRLQWRALEALNATAEGAVAGIGQIVPDLVEDRRAIVARVIDAVLPSTRRQRMRAERAPTRSPSSGSAVPAALSGA
ncbi:hypothetical protein AM484_001129, partial [Pseudomonas aeruginosa]